MVQLSARRWARAHGSSSPVAAALGGVIAAINNGTYSFDPQAQACPVLDMSLGAKAHWKPRLPFLLSPVVDGDADGHAVADEYVDVNSVCRSDPAQDIEGGENPENVSVHRIPDAAFDATLFPGDAPPPEERKA